MRFVQLDTLRYIFASFIVLGHTSGWDKTVPAGALAVDFFFVLSGFVLTYAITKENRQTGLTRFVVSRIARLFPLYYLSSLILFIIAYSQGSLPPVNSVFFQNLFLLQNVMPSGNAGYNWPAWSVSAELWINISIFFLVVKYRSIPAALILSLYCYFTLMSQNIIDHAHIQQINMTTAGIYRYTAGLSLGYLVYRLFCYVQPLLEEQKTGSFLIFSFLELITGTLILNFLFAYDMGSKWSVIALIPFFILVFACGKGILSNLFASGWIKESGNYTYGIYLLHAPLLIFSRGAGLIPPTDTETPLGVVFLVLLFVTLLAIPIYKYFELPSKYFIRNSLSPRHA